MRQVFSALSLAFVFSLSGCATMMDGANQTVTVNSNPVGAAVHLAVRDKKGQLIEKGQIGVTPATVSIGRKDSLLIVKQSGYQDFLIEPKKKMNPWVLGDVVLTSLLSTSIDTSTGAAKEIDPSEFFVELKPAN